MKKINDLDYLKLSKPKKFLYKLLCFFIGIGLFFKRIGLGIWHGIKWLGLFIKNDCIDIVDTFKNGNWKTKVSYIIMGFGNMTNGQIGRGIFFLLFEAIFIIYMIMNGGYWLSMYGSLGKVCTVEAYNPVLDSYSTVHVDNSFNILLYGTLTIVFILSFLYTWRLNVKQNKVILEIIASGKKVKSGKDDLRSLVDDQFHKTLLALPLLGIMMFTVLPIIFMILVAFTSYDGMNDGYANLFTWVGLNNFNELLAWDTSSGKQSAAFSQILGWTLMWAFFATFSNYFLGMIVAMIINKKGIRLKKMWRSFLVMTIAIPQFISLLYVANMFSKNGLVNGFLIDMHLVTYETKIDFWGTPWLARLMVILINIWIGIPYLMLISTGVLMNIPKDLYESARIDGANTFQQYTKITLPYMLFVTGPYLLTSFIGNINNFNVIYLLTGGGPDNSDLLTSGGTAGDTDLLITWLFKMTTGATANYKLASVVGILIFVVVSVLSLIVYNIMPSTRNEEDFS